jgi:histidine triad (HIT) family protein
MSSIFTKIIKGELPSVKVHEDDHTLVIMDINPIQEGQLLVIPKKEVSTVWDLSKEDYNALMDSVQRAGKSLRKLFPNKTIGIMVEGLEVKDHAHVKVFPFSSVSEYHAVPSTSPTTEDLEKLAKRLAF